MLNSISWQKFLIGLTLLVSGYYFIAVLRLYAREILAFLKGGSKRSGQPATKNASTDSVTGAIVTEGDQHAISHSTVSLSEEIAFAPDDDLPEEIQPAKAAVLGDELLVGTIANALEEIKTVLAAIAAAGDNKVQAASLFQSLLSRYPRLAGTPYQEAITLFICETAKAQLPFSLSPGEVAMWWKVE